MVLASTLSLMASSAAASAATIPSIATLEQQARSRTTAKTRVPMVPASSPVFQGIDSLEVPASDRVPNYLRALAMKPALVKPFSHLIKAFVYDGTVQPARKLA